MRRGDGTIETKYTLLFQPVSKIDASYWLYLKKIDDKFINQIWLLPGPVFLVFEIPWRSLCPRPRQDPDPGASRSCKSGLKTCLWRYKNRSFHQIPFENTLGFQTFQGVQARLQTSQQASGIANKSNLSLVKKIGLEHVQFTSNPSFHKHTITNTSTSPFKTLKRAPK